MEMRNLFDLRTCGVELRLVPFLLRKLLLRIVKSSIAIALGGKTELNPAKIGKSRPTMEMGECSLFVST
jgi:hypothetical protein